MPNHPEESIIVNIFTQSDKSRDRFTDIFRSYKEVVLNFFDEFSEFQEKSKIRNCQMAIVDVDAKVMCKSAGSQSVQEAFSCLLALRNECPSLYLIALTEDKKFINISSFYDMGIQSVIFREDKIKEMRVEVLRGLEHVEHWKAIFGQLRDDKVVEKEFMELYNDADDDSGDSGEEAA
jgi:hypothetical protein